MPSTPFHSYVKTRELAEWMYGDNRLLAAYASADIKIFPYQLAAAMFALRSPYLKGVILPAAGQRWPNEGQLADQTSFGPYGSAKVAGESNVYYFSFYDNTFFVNPSNANVRNGFSLRCIKK